MCGAYIAGTVNFYSEITIHTKFVKMDKNLKCINDYRKNLLENCKKLKK